MRLSKYHGLGNDFIIGKQEELSNIDYSELAKKVCHRQTGFGADGLILVKEEPLEMIYYNSDGSRAEMCGNGIRCFSKYLFDEKLVLEKEYSVLTLAGDMRITVKNTDPFLVQVNMGQADFNPESFASSLTKEVIEYKISLPNEDVVIDSLLLGVPHTLLEVKDLKKKYMVKVGPIIEKHELFNNGTNVNFYQIIDRSHIKMQTFERGAGLTLACGTGACATYAMLLKKNLVDEKVIVSLPLGDLIITEHNGDIIMTGPAEKVGNVYLEDKL